MKELSPGTIKQRALISAQRVDLEYWFGDSFLEYWHKSQYEYDLSEFFATQTELEISALEFLISESPRFVLDVGAGSGRISAWLRDAGINVVPCDNDPVCAEICRNNGFADVREQSFIELAEVFDAVVLFGGGIPCLGEVPDVKKAVLEFLKSLAARVAAQGQLLIDLTNYDAPSMRDTHWKVTKCRFKLDIEVGEYEFYIYPHRDIVTRLLLDLGFTLRREWLEEDIMGEAVNHRWIGVFRKD